MRMGRKRSKHKILKDETAKVSLPPRNLWIGDQPTHEKTLLWQCTADWIVAGAVIRDSCSGEEKEQFFQEYGYSVETEPFVLEENSSTSSGRIKPQYAIVPCLSAVASQISHLKQNENCGRFLRTPSGTPRGARTNGNLGSGSLP